MPLNLIRIEMKNFATRKAFFQLFYQPSLKFVFKHRTTSKIREIECLRHFLFPS